MITVPGQPSDAPEADTELTDPVDRVMAAPPAQQPAPAAAAAEPDPIDQVMGGGADHVARIEVARQAAGQQTPEQAARILRLEGQTGLPHDFISSDPDAVERAAADKAFSPSELVKSSPKFAAWMAANPNHYAFAKDDVGFFGRIEKGYNSFVEGVQSMPIQHELAVLQNKDMDQGLTPGEAQFKAELEAQAKAQMLSGQGDGAISSKTRLVGSTLAQIGMFGLETAKGAMVGASAGAVAGAAAGPAGAVPAAAAGAEVGGASAGWAYAYHLERGAMFDELKSITDIDGKPIDKSVARNVATAYAAANATIMMSGGYAIAKLSPLVGDMLSGMSRQSVASAVRVALAQPSARTGLLAAAKTMTESGGLMAAINFTQSLMHSAARETAQALSPSQAFTPDSGAEDLKKAAGAGAEGFAGMFLTAGITHGLPAFMGQMREADRATRAQQFYQALGEGKDSAAFKNLPDKAQEAVAAIVADGPRKTAYIDTQAWSEYFQKAGLDPREAAAEVIGDTKAFDTAVQAGHELAIPIDRYARKIAVNPEANKFFSQELRYEPGAMNAREARVLFQKIEDEARLMPASEHFVDPNAPGGIEQVKADVIRQLKNAGVDEKTARTQAELLSAFKSLGERAGIEPAELYKRYNLRIRNAEQAAAQDGGQVPAGETFYQRAKRVVQKALGVTPHPTETPEFKAWFGKSKIVDEAGKPQVVYHGTESAFDQFKVSKIGEFGPGIYFSSSPDEAGGYASTHKEGKGANTVPVYLSIKNPFTGSADDFFRQFRAGSDAESISKAEAAGYDGIAFDRPEQVFRRTPNGGEVVETGKRVTHYVAFHPEQIKSAIGNSGAFNPKDARILFQRDALPYKPYENLAPEQRVVETGLAERLAQPAAVEEYAKLPGTMGGKVINLDEARYLSPEYAKDKASRTQHTLSTQKPAGAFAEKMLADRLAEPGDGIVMFMAGGGGSGKSTVSGSMLAEAAARADVIFDSVFAHMDKAVARIEAALSSGRDVAIAYVHRDAVEAARDGVAGRFDETGRWVPADVLAADHVNAQETIFALAERYREDDRVLFKFFENKTGQTPVEITLDDLLERSYTLTDETADEAIQRLLPIIQGALKDVERQAQEAAGREGDVASQGQAQGVRGAGEQERAGELGARSEDGSAADELTYHQDPGDGVRGRTRIGPNRQVNIDLLKKANLSTFVHELWHFYFEVMGDLAGEMSRLPDGKRSRGQQGIVDDYATLLAHVGAKDRAGVTDAMHEEIARLGEAYLMEGKAPSSELRRAFARFQVWLTHIYRDIKSLAVDLKPEVAKVFDRMLATDDAIEAAEREQNVAPLFDDPEKLLGTKDAQKYLAAVADARAEAEAELSAKVMGEVRREQEDWWKTERAKMQQEVAGEIDAQPVYKALAALTSREPDAPQLKLDRAAIDEMWAVSESSKNALPRGITAKEGGVHPAIAAEMFGFKNAYELLDALAAAEPRRALLDRLTDERMAEVHGDLAHDVDKMHDEALAAVHNKKRSELLRRELEILAEKHMSDLKGITARIARKPPTVEAVRTMAEGMIGSRAVKEITPFVYQRAEAKASKEAVAAMLKGDFEASFAAKQREFLNHELYRAAIAAREDVDKSLERFKKVARGDDALAKTRDIDLVNAARAVLASFGIGKAPKENAVGYLEQMARYDPDMHATVTALVQQAKGGGSYENATYDQFVALRDTVDALWDLSKRTRQILIDGKLLERGQVMAEMSNRLAEVGGAAQRVGYDRAVTNWEKTKIGLMGIRAALRRVESWVEAIDGGDRNGVFRRYLWTPISEATASYRVDRRAFLERYLGIVKGVEKSLTFSEIKAPELGYTFRDKAELLGALLHSGNESNLSKLLRGRGWGEFSMGADGEKVLDRSKWDSFTARARAEGVLTREDYQYAQAVWNLLEELKPRAQKAHKDMYGYYFGEVSSKGFDVAFPGEGGSETAHFRGGYVPAVTDPFMAVDAAIRQEREDLEGGNNSFMFPTAGRGFTKGRVENYAAPLMMDVRFVPGHIDKVLRFIHIEPRVKDVARIVMDRNFRKTLDGFDPAVGGDMLVPWLQRAAQQRIETPSQGWGGRAADTFFRTLRSRTGLNIMFANVANTLLHPINLSISFVKVDPQYMRSALWDYVRAPSKMAEDIAAKSEFMSSRESGKMMEVRSTIDELMLEPSKYEKVREFASRHGYFMQNAVWNQIDTITWRAAYDKATAEGSFEKEAVRFADSMVRETQGSMAPEDISRFETGTPFTRAFTMFYSYFNAQANLMGTEFSMIARDMGLKKGAGKLLYAYTFGFMIPALMSEAIVKSVRGEKWDEDDDGYLDDAMGFFFGSQFRYATAMFPFVGPTVNAGVSAWQGKGYDDRITTSPAVATIESSVAAPHSVYQALHDKTHARKAIRESLTLLGMLSGLPLAALARPAGYIADVEAGNVHPKNAADYARGLASGTGSK